MTDDQITLRLPAELAKLVARKARERGVPKSQMVREALQAYLADPDAGTGDAWKRVSLLVGSQPLDSAGVERDDLARQLRDHNWRD